MLADDLLDQALHLATRDQGQPNQADLRRALSSAYYALFHLLCAEAVERLGSTNPPLLNARIARTLSHSEMKQVCKSIASERPTSILLELQPGGFSRALHFLAECFVELQEERHRADYDLATEFEQVEVLRQLRRVRASFDLWRLVRDDDEATIFLAALLFAGRWAK